MRRGVAGKKKKRRSRVLKGEKKKKEKCEGEEVEVKERKGNTREEVW